MISLVHAQLQAGTGIPMVVWRRSRRRCVDKVYSLPVSAVPLERVKEYFDFFEFTLKCSHELNKSGATFSHRTRNRLVPAGLGTARQRQSPLAKPLLPKTSVMLLHMCAPNGFPASHPVRSAVPSCSHHVSDTYRAQWCSASTNMLLHPYRRCMPLVPT